MFDKPLIYAYDEALDTFLDEDSKTTNEKTPLEEYDDTLHRLWMNEKQLTPAECKDGTFIERFAEAANADEPELKLENISIDQLEEVLDKLPRNTFKICTIHNDKKHWQAISMYRDENGKASFLAFEPSMWLKDSDSDNLAQKYTELVACHDNLQGVMFGLNLQKSFAGCPTHSISLAKAIHEQRAFFIGLHQKLHNDKNAFKNLTDGDIPYINNKKLRNSTQAWRAERAPRIENSTKGRFSVVSGYEILPANIFINAESNKYLEDVVKRRYFTNIPIKGKDTLLSYSETFTTNRILPAGKPIRPNCSADVERMYLVKRGIHQEEWERYVKNSGDSGRLMRLEYYGTDVALFPSGREKPLLLAIGNFTKDVWMKSNSVERVVESKDLADAHGAMIRVGMSEGRAWIDVHPLQRERIAKRR